ncbi:uncharacterized protein LOC130622770 [Hydractinia symbiolongicarpus]|uniref:uncharacterized protein LOC130622770 n=1 Tax=Hydractinia symbiolongicarpus TaxID=13093 RepID=UPI002549E7D2|nr:uncharacterized protein LOC130622770 [Hydractinia symbiolongicarpus]
MYKTVQLLLVIIHRTILLAVTFVVGSLIFAKIEHISYERSGFFCWTVVTTIGYGKIVPITNWGKIFTMIYGIIGISITMFCLVSYGSFLNHCIKKLIVATERYCCTNKQVAYLHFKLFIALFLLGISEVFLGGYVLYELNDWSFFYSVYTWFVSISTIGFGDFVPNFPPEKNIVKLFVVVVFHFFCIVTFASVIEAIQGMVESVNNNSRGVWSIIFCCYKNEEYKIKRDSNSSLVTNHNAEMDKTAQLFLVIVHRSYLLAVTFVVGTLIFAEIEHITYERSGFFCWTVVTTIGYGAPVPSTYWAKIFTMIYGIIGIPITMFCLVSYGSFLNHCIKKLIVATERCCCTNKQVAYLHFKLFIALFLLGISEMFLGGCALYGLNDWSFLDSLYTWFVSISTIGFGDFVPNFPPEKNIVKLILIVVIHFFCMVTFTSVIEAIQGMVESVNNNSRGVWPIIFCCYKNEEKESYKIQRESNSSLITNQNEMEEDIYL